MKINQKKIIILSIVLISFIGLIGIGLSYSYYLANISTNNKDNKTSDITTTSIAEAVMDMQGKVAVKNAYPGHKAVKEVVVRGIGDTSSVPANASIKITPDLGVFTGDITWKLYKSEESISCNNTLQVTDSGAYEEATCTIPSSAALELEGSSTSLYKNIVVSPNSETKYYLVVEYLNKEDEDQSSQMNNTFSIDISLNEKVLNFAESITNLSNDDKVNFATDDADKNVRYIGANPDNYVYFNCSDYNNQSDSTCEKWRIIGLFNNITKSDGTKENLVKIIRDESIGDYSWNGNKTNDWSTATLQTYLNSGTYYTITLKNDTTRNAIEDVVWNLGGTNAYDTSTASMFYAAERGTTVYSGRMTTLAGKIGLMYPSDYGYATTGGNSMTRRSCLAKEIYDWYASDVRDCYNNDYLFKSNYYQWTLAPNSDNPSYVFFVGMFGDVHNDNADTTNGVRPTIYLKSNISINSGTGSSDNPYRLNL